MNQDKKTRARIAILSQILAFPSISGQDWTSCLSNDIPQINDLVAMNCAPYSKWYLSWLHKIENNNGLHRYLLESIEDGEMCWWVNIGLSYYNREKVLNNPSWKWSDEQFEFNDRWQKVFRKNNAFLLRPCEPIFLKNGAVMLNIRVCFNLNGYRNPIQFPNWKKVTVKMMDNYYKSTLKEYESR